VARRRRSEGSAVDAQALPVVLRPYHGESLYGFALRLDEANTIPAGTLARVISRDGRGPGRRAQASYQYVANLYDLPLLAALVETQQRAIEALTYRRQLWRLFGPSASASRLGPGAQFRVCPMCVATRRFVGLETTLPLGRRAATLCCRSAHLVRIRSGCVSLRSGPVRHWTAHSGIRQGLSPSGSRSSAIPMG
jgi:hypothetical protein